MFKPNKFFKHHNSYTRFNLPYTNYFFIKWMPKSNTTIHNHDGKDCKFIILNGSLQEIRYKNVNINSLYQSKEIRPLKFNIIKDKDGYHQIYNFDDRFKYSIHHYYNEDDSKK